MHMQEHVFNFFQSENRHDAPGSVRSFQSQGACPLMGGRECVLCRVCPTPWETHFFAKISPGASICLQAFGIGNWGALITPGKCNFTHLQIPQWKRHSELSRRDRAEAGPSCFIELMMQLPTCSLRACLSDLRDSYQAQHQEMT